MMSKKVEMNVEEKSFNQADLPRNSETKTATKQNKRRNSHSQKKNTRKQTNKNAFSKRNDPAYYNRYVGLVEGSANYNFLYPLGNELNYNDVPSIERVVNSIPGIMELRFIPTIGYTNSSNSAVNISLQNLRAYLQTTVSRKLEFDAADFGMYIFAWDSVYIWYTMLVRAYATIGMYDPVNRYIPEALLSAQGFDAADLRSHQAELFYFINRLAVSLSRYNVPGGFKILERHQWMVNGVYADAQTMKPQTYVYTPVWLYKYVETQGVGYLDVAAPTNGFVNVTYDQIVAFTDQLLIPLQQSGDIWDMSSIFGNGFGQDNCMKVLPIESDLRLSIGYRPEVLTQINNATLIGIPNIGDATVKTAWQIRQGELDTGEKTGALIQTPLNVYTYTGTNYYENPSIPNSSLRVSNRVLNVMSTSQDDILEATRLTVIYKTRSIDYALKECTVDFGAVGSEVVANIVVYWFSKDSTNPQGLKLKSLPLNENLIDLGQTAIVADYCTLLANITTFD